MTSLPSTFDDRVLVHLTRGFSSQEKAARRHYVRIRRVAVAAAIAWLQGNNPIYCTDTDPWRGKTELAVTLA